MITLEMNDWNNIPLWNQKISILSKLDKNEHVKWNFEPSFILYSIGELKIDWNAIVLCLLNLSNNVDNEQSLHIIINKLTNINLIIICISLVRK
jgi:hypothetical protein